MNATEIIKLMQEDQEIEAHPLYLTYTQWQIDGRPVDDEIAEKLEKDGLIEFVQIVGSGQAHMYFLTEKGKLLQ